ncbi:MAG: hypothetical protein R2911_00495 [Caldilineaceae bacterium]
MTEIRLLDALPAATKITQLYPHLELFSEGEPSRHTLFVMGGAPPISLSALNIAGDQSAAHNQLLLIDPPADVRSRFRLEGDVAALFTGPPLDVGLPVMQTQPGGVAHIRIGEHFLDIYAQGGSSQEGGNIVVLPALGIVCGGVFASDVGLPAVAPHSDGGAESETLRLLARLVKQRPLQLYIPQVGTLGADSVEVMRRLAADVAYLHNLRRVIPALAQRHDGLEHALEMADALLPEGRRSAIARQCHQKNVQNMMG